MLNLKNNVNYFFIDYSKIIDINDKEINIDNENITSEQQSFNKFLVGDILNIIYWKDGIIYKCEGVCISIKKKLSNIDSSFILRNVILGVGLEFTVSYFNNRAYNLTISSYKKKNNYYKKSKLFYLRSKVNRGSRVK